MRSEGNVYNPVPERIPKVRDADEFHGMKAKYFIKNENLVRLLICLELPSLLAISDCTNHSFYLQIQALEGFSLFG
jgi:hypothetical protein